MPRIHQEKGFRFFFYTDEHEPKHIHAFKSGGKVKIELETLAIVHQKGLKDSEAKQALTITRHNQKQFIQDWDEYFME